MRKMLISVSGFALVIGLNIVSLCAQEATPWGSPWVAQPKTNIHDLIDQGYKVVDADVEFVAVTGGIFEAIYLMKDGQLYRCVTGQRKDTVVHGCETCVAPKKRE